MSYANSDFDWLGSTVLQLTKLYSRRGPKYILDRLLKSSRRHVLAFRIRKNLVLTPSLIGKPKDKWIFSKQESLWDSNWFFKLSLKLTHCNRIWYSKASLDNQKLQTLQIARTRQNSSTSMTTSMAKSDLHWVHQLIAYAVKMEKDWSRLHSKGSTNF